MEILWFWTTLYSLVLYFLCRKEQVEDQMICTKSFNGFAAFLSEARMAALKSKDHHVLSFLFMSNSLFSCVSYFPALDSLQKKANFGENTILSLQGASVATKTCSDDVKSASQITRWRITQPGRSWLRDWAHETCVSHVRSSTSSFLFLQSLLSCKLAIGNLWPKCYHL